MNATLEPCALGDPGLISSMTRYHGSKAAMAPAIDALLGDNTLYCEPFMGSAAVLMGRREARVEIANDLYCHAWNLALTLASEELAARLSGDLARVLIDGGVLADAIDTLSAVETAEASFGVPLSTDTAMEAAGSVYAELAGCDLGTAEVRVRWARDYLVASWLSAKAELTGTGAFLGSVRVGVRASLSGGSLSARWRAVQRSIPVWHARLRWVQFRRCDAMELLEQLEDSPKVSIYADPPYIPADGGDGRDAGAMYAHGWASAGLFVEADDGGDDHDRLAAVLNAKRRSRVVVSYYAHPRLEALYPAEDGWLHLDAPQPKRCANKGGESSPEVLICRNLERADLDRGVSMVARRAEGA